MKKRQVGRVLGVGAVAGAAYAAWRAYKARMAQPPAESQWAPAPFPFPPIPRPAPTARPHVNGDSTANGNSNGSGAGKVVGNGNGSSVEPVDGECPPSHPVKGKLASGIYHLPGGLNYARTRPDRCYTDAAAAESDGLRPAKL